MGFCLFDAFLEKVTGDGLFIFFLVLLFRMMFCCCSDSCARKNIFDLIRLGFLTGEHCLIATKNEQEKAASAFYSNYSANTQTEIKPGIQPWFTMIFQKLLSHNMKIFNSEYGFFFKAISHFKTCWSPTRALIRCKMFFSVASYLALFHRSMS